MNGAQDLGGMMGFGPVAPEPNEPVFHAEWERRACGLWLASAMMGEWNIDFGRHARESLHPVDYLASSYYEIWMRGLEKIALAIGLVTAEELAEGHKRVPARLVKRPGLKPDQVRAILAQGSPYDRPIDRAPRFSAGDKVRARNFHPTGHTRLPRYARGKLGVVERRHGGFVFPDSNAHGKGEDPQWLYSVTFAGTELWGPDSDPTLSVAIDCWEPYLEPA
jgi:nitrile hydratase